MPDDITSKIDQWKNDHKLEMTPDAYAALIKMTSASMAAAPYRLTMRSGVSALNDNPIGDFFDAKTAYLIGSLLKALDENDHPEYMGYDVQENFPVPKGRKGLASGGPG